MNPGLFGPKNIKLFLVSIIGLIIGYILLGQGPVDNPLSLSVAPVILVLVYCVLIPYAIIARDKKEATPSDKKQKQ
jgi:uncharacterized membrane protein